MDIDILADPAWHLGAYSRLQRQLDEHGQRQLPLLTSQKSQLDQTVPLLPRQIGPER